MGLGRVDLNLLFYLDVLLRERNVTKAANQLGLSQPAMSNGLKRLREMFSDPLLVRTSEGMVPTERALELQPVIRTVLATVDQAVQPHARFDAATSNRVFRIMASDYEEATIIPEIILRLRQQAPYVTLDIMTPSDISFPDVEQGKVDLVINRFDTIPQSFHKKDLWHDGFACLMNAENPLQNDFTLEHYLQAEHIWVSKTGMGIGVGMDPGDVQRLGWVDEALARQNKQRHIAVFTRHYQSAMALAQQTNLVVTLPSQAARLQAHNPKVVIKHPPFPIPPICLTMAWSPLLQHNPAHQWIRRLITEVANEIGAHSQISAPDGQPAPGSLLSDQVLLK